MVVKKIRVFIFFKDGVKACQNGAVFDYHSAKLSDTAAVTGFKPVKL